MRGFLFVVVIAAAGFSSGVVRAQEKDAEGGQDHPLVSRMTGYYLGSYDVKNFDAIEVSLTSYPAIPLTQNHLPIKLKKPEADACQKSKVLMSRHKFSGMI